MGKNKKQTEKTTDPSGESQKLGNARKMPTGVFRRGAQGTK